MVRVVRVLEICLLLTLSLPAWAEPPLPTGLLPAEPVVVQPIAPVASETNPTVCLRMFSHLNEGPARTAAFWARTSPVKAGNHVYKFGFDAELWQVSDIFDIIAKDPKALENAEAALTQANDFYTIQKIQQITGAESLDAARALLRVPQDHEIVLTDLKPTALRKWKHGNAEKSKYAKLLQVHVEESLKNRGIPVSAKLESFSGEHRGENSVELVMDGAISSPAKFKKLVDWLYDEVDAPETHFHVSVPKAFIESDALIFAARAVETKILLEQVVSNQNFSGQGHYPWDVSTLHVDLAKVRNDDMPHSERGVVRVESERWQDPVVAHDIEIRDWLDKDHGLESLYIMTQLASKSGHLRDTSSFQASALRNTSPPNLNGALRYAAIMLNGKLPRDKGHIVTELTQLAQELERSRTLTDVSRKKVADYLKDNNVLYYLDLNKFLEWKIMPDNQPLPVVAERLPEPQIENGIKLSFARDDQGVLRIPVARVKEGRSDKLVAEFTLDPHKPERQTIFNVQPGEKVSLFDWHEPAATDYEQVQRSGLQAMRHAFDTFGQTRLVAIGSNNYERTNLTLLGFKMIRGTEAHQGGPRYELYKNHFTGELIPPRFQTYMPDRPGVLNLTSINSAQMPSNHVADGIHYEYYVPNEYKPTSMRMSMEKVSEREGGRPKHLVEWVLDTEKPRKSTRLSQIAYGYNQKPAFFDWEEAARVADGDYGTIYDGGRKFIDHAFNDFHITQLFAVGNSAYTRDVLEELGFVEVPETGREPIYQLTREMHQPPVPPRRPVPRPGAR